MRKETQLKTDDNYIIYGTLDSNNNQRLIIFVHGFTGNKDEHHYFNAVPFFNKKKFDTFRFDFYSRNIHARPLTESCITTHSKDLRSIIDNFKDKYDELILIGHSFGPLVILSTDLSNITKIILWEPTTPFKNIEDKKATYDSNLNTYIFQWGMDFLVSKTMVDEWMSADLNYLVEKLSIPCKIIFAGNSNKHELWKPYLNKIKAQNKSVIIDGATHGFIEEGTEQKLFEETLKWIK